ncbi:MAG: bifunctional serine/threonine-protein kinase/formylglycine-generating enzyme family protein [Phormidium sp.]
MICCLNPDCPNPINPDGTQYCQSCRTKMIPLLRGRFRIIKPLGQGGFGRTYLAEDEDKLKERCVVKQLAPNVSGTWALNKAVQLFQQEAQQLQALGGHPQIPALYAYFEEGGFLYLVQQFINGQNLLELLEQNGVWRESEIRQLLLDILPILTFIHSRKIIHRDIKPENIMRNRTDGLPVLIDFGVSKELSQTVMGRTGTNIGSQGYAPIEQMQDGKAYPASDLFSLGATCFHLLTGEHPYRLWIKNGYSWTANWRQYLKTPISNELSRILNKLLQEDMQQRYQSAEEVLRDLQPPPPPPPSTSPQTRRDFLQYAGFASLGLMGVFLYRFLFANQSSETEKSRSLRNSLESKSPTSTPISPETESPTPTPIPPSPTKPATPANNLSKFSFEVVTVNASGAIINRQNREAEFFREDINGVTLEIVSIPGGTFLMGSPNTEEKRYNDEGPQHQVTVAAFFMGKYPVTQAQWEAVAALPQANISLKTNPSNFKGANRPVEQVSWNEAQEFCTRLSQKTGKIYRLPSEAEWEYACRAGTTTPFYFGETITTDLVNYDGNYTYASAPKGIYRQQTTDVGSFPPNAFGLYDMHGNVWEWCADIYHDNYNGAPSDGKAWESGGNDRYRLLRGGSWSSYPWNCRSASRVRDESDSTYRYCGFRVVALTSAWTS